jgi:hypothetical protein
MLMIWVVRMGLRVLLSNTDACYRDSTVFVKLTAYVSAAPGCVLGYDGATGKPQ